MELSRFILYVIWYKLILYLFFQAEDGIRDGHVTGVQTCALPISGRCLRGGGAHGLGLFERFLGPVLEGIAGLQPGLDRGARVCVIGGRSVIGGRGGLGVLGHPSGPLPLLDELRGGQRAGAGGPAAWGRRVTGRAPRVARPRGGGARLPPGLDRGARVCVIGGRSVSGGRGGLGVLGHPSGPLPLLDELRGGQRARSAAPAPWGGRITGRADRVPLPRGSADLPLPCSSAVDVLGWILVHACALTGAAFMPAPSVRPRSAPGAAEPARAPRPRSRPRRSGRGRAA